MRLIDADALLLARGIRINQLARMIIMEQPTIESEPVRHGRWVPVTSLDAFGGDAEAWYAHGNPIAFYYCSECEEQAYADEHGESIVSKFCPNCGARMDLGGASGLIDADAIEIPMMGTESDERWTKIAIDAAPTIDAEPVRHRWWSYWEWCEPGDMPQDYCPCCGAHMDLPTEWAD